MTQAQLDGIADLLADKTCEKCDELIGEVCFNCVLLDGFSFSYSELTPLDLEALYLLGFEARCDCDRKQIDVWATDRCKLLF